MNLDDVVPVADHLTHQSRVIEAPRRVVWDELHRLRLRSLPVSLVLSAFRAMPLLLTGRSRDAVERTYLGALPIPTLSSEPPTAVVFGGVLRARRSSRGVPPPVLDADGVRDFSEPGWVKIGMEFRLTPAVGGTHMSSETRIAATDPATRRRFNRYWFVVGPGNSATRWEVLNAVATRAEAHTRRPPL